MRVFQGKGKNLDQMQGEISYIVEAWNINRQGTMALIHFTEACFAVATNNYVFLLFALKTSTELVLPGEIVFTQRFDSRGRQPILFT